MRKTFNKSKAPTSRQSEEDFGKKNKYDAFEKVKKVIKGCITDDQFEVAREMICLFSGLYMDDSLRVELCKVYSEEFKRGL